jgi:sugar phosphate isomerase/epimerase
MAAARIPIALQLYSIRKDAESDLPGVFKAVKDMGYDGVEFAGWYGHDAATIRKMLDDNGLQIAGAHIGIDTLLGDELEKSVEFHRTLGNKYLIVPGLGDKYRSSTDEWRRTAGLFNQIAANLRPHGMLTGYHNHSIEFKPFEAGGELPWDTFFGNTNPEVIMQFDTGNALHGGSDALPFLQRYPGRAVTVHLKEYDPDNDKALIGEGKVPFPAIFDVCESTGGTQWYIVEQESYAYPPMECAKRCLDTLRAMGK